MNKSIEIPEKTRADQFAASSPHTSAWVSANAGSGKTHVLTQRVIRLMLAGNAPDRILCLTFTKAAAAEMKNRVFKTLGAWAMMADAELDTAIHEMSGTRADEQSRSRARQLFASALDTPGGLKIQTIHAFCESLLHQFPLEANVPGHFETLQEAEQNQLLETARASVLATSSRAAQHYAALIEHASDSAIEDGLKAVIAMREAFDKWIDDDVDEAMVTLYEALGVSRSDTVTGIKQEAIASLPVSRDQMRSLVEAAAAGSGKSDRSVVQVFTAILEGAAPEADFSELQKLLLTAKNEIQKRLVTKAVDEIYPEAIEILKLCAGHVMQALDKITARRLLKNSSRLFKISREVLERYAALKRARGVIDFDDQIQKCANLLNRADIRQWIRYRLDRGIDHVLVDEAQDTSPAQWQVINAITSDFHAGKTASSTKRTVFVVGDEKQSIYSFQGARPEEFAQQARKLKARVSGSGNAFHPGTLNLSFRSTGDVLKAVDKVFADPENAAGLTQVGEPTTHDAIRAQDPGEVQIWPLYEKIKIEQNDNWLDPVDKPESDDPAIELAARITQTVKQWVGKPLPGTGVPLKFGDILVLVRTRDRFSAALNRAMKDAGLAVAGADRLKLTEHIAVEDLLAIGRFVLMPQDDLSLAAILKSPFFDLDEETLYALAQPRGNQSLYDQVQITAADKSHPASATASNAANKLDVFIRLGRQLGVFEFYARLLGEHGGRKAILARLGREAEDVIHAFLDEALSFERAGKAGLEAFVANLTSAGPEIKREVDLERDEVRIMTLHSAKGLEAPVVFLVDSCKAIWSEKFRPPVLAIGDAEHFAGYLWMAETRLHISPTLERVEKIREEAAAEYRRLLYVGMTRAADRLIVCGYKGLHDVKPPHWHAMVKDALAGEAREMHDDTGAITGWRWVYKDQPPREAKAVVAGANADEQPAIPSWLFSRAKPEPPLPRPLTPSGAYGLIDRDSRTRKGRRLTGTATQNASAVKRGNFTHRLLEVLPNLDPGEWQEAADDYLARVAADWEKQECLKLRNAVIDVLKHPAFAGLYKQGTRAEVTITGRLDTASGPRLVSGQIDRLVVSDSQVVIIDYKTNRIVPQTPVDAGHDYLAQLSLYRELIAQIYPDHEIVCAFLWTRTPALMVIPDALLDETLQAIKNG